MFCCVVVVVRVLHIHSLTKKKKALSIYLYHPDHDKLYVWRVEEGFGFLFGLEKRNFL